MLEEIKTFDVTTYDYWIANEDIPNKRCKVISIQGQVIFEDEQQVSVALMSEDGPNPTCYATLAVVPKMAIVGRKSI